MATEQGRQFTWWNCSDLMDLFQMVTAEGANNLRLEYHAGEEESLKLVDAETGEECGSYNASHTCPPQCP